MSATYDPQAIETKWQARWREMNLFATPSDRSKPKFYYLDMFPYPSGQLHMGHVRNYVIGDCIARQKIMRGWRVMHPMGWDAFGLPAENAAIAAKTHPGVWTERCIAQMRKQIERLGISYDWNLEINTSSPEYYKWTQWVFVQLFNAGLAERKDAPVNWCPSCATVLANEQVIDGACERCGTRVVRRRMAQWFFKTTAYAERLLQDLELLTEWPERVRTMQRNWIGRSEGAEVDFTIAHTGEKLTVFTTRPDTLFGATFMVLAPEHPLVEKLIEGRPEAEAVRQLVQECASQSEIERTAEGAEKKGAFTGCYAINPVNDEHIPIWVANYVLLEYGTGAIMAVPAHDQRDLDFARKYGLPVRVVIQPEGEELDPETMTEAWVGEGRQVNSGQFDGLPSAQGKEAICDWLEERGLGRRAVAYRLRDWCISRQRYWGAPIPIIYCDKCGPCAVPEEDLPVLLPEDVDLSQSGRSPLATSEAFVRATCPKCGGPGRREVDTMDTFVCSSWYYLRYPNPNLTDRPFDWETVNEWLPVDLYVGGVEHAVLHLYYSRFVTKALHDLGYVNFVEPFKRLFTQGMIVKDGAKMSKSKGNVVTPDEIIERHGADSLRLFILFAGPPELDAEWSDAGVAGCHRFLSRTHNTIASRTAWFVPSWREEIAQAELSPTASDLRRKTHQTIRRVTRDIEERMRFNTAISALMELQNELGAFCEKVGEEPAPGERLAFSEAAEMMCLLLSPFAPHLADELWERLGHEGSTYQQSWPEFDEEIAAEQTLEIPVQINGKVRERVYVAADADEQALEEAALAAPRIKQLLQGKAVHRVVVVPGRLVNIVAK